MTEVGPEGRVRVNCGLQHPISLLVPPEMAVEEGERVTVRISSREPLRARLVDDPPPGFRVESAELSEACAREGPAVATSRHGTPLTVSGLGELVPHVRDDCLVAFGAPGRGLPEILGLAPEEVSEAAHDVAEIAEAVADAASDGAADQGPAGDGNAGDGGPVEPDPGFDLWLNTIPKQGSEVVRTEEAMFATLAPLTLTE